MFNNEQAKKKQDSRCRHFNGIQNKLCEAKIAYGKFVNNLPCYGDSDWPCIEYSPLTITELAAKEAAFNRHMDLMRRGLSNCCEAPFDTSQVITKGRYKGHGPRFCSKCKTACFIV